MKQRNNSLGDLETHSISDQNQLDRTGKMTGSVKDLNIGIIGMGEVRAPIIPDLFDRSERELEG